jgi:hypothetical protein
MALRTYMKTKLLISQDNSANPSQVAFNSGDVEYVDATLYNEESSKTLSIAPSTVDQQVSLDTIAVAAIVFAKTDATGVTIKLVPPDKVLADVSAMTLKAGMPLVVPCDTIEVYVSNPSTTDSAKVTVAAVGN